MKAIITKALGQAELVHNQPPPKLRDDYILVKVEAVALNPIDWMKIDGFPAPGAVQGHDYSGTVLEVGKAVKANFSKGDRICGTVRGGDCTQLENGAFAEFLVAKGDIQFHIPDHVSFEEAAGIGIGTQTAGLALFQRLGLQLPDASDTGDGEFFLVYGGSTASGILGIQLAALSGYNVIATCSERNFDFVKSFGAHKVFDYRDPECGKLIHECTQDQLSIVYDTISVSKSADVCAEAISSKGGRYCSLLPVEFPRSDVQASFMDGHVAFGEYYEYGPNRIPISPDPEGFEFASRWARTIDRLWAEKRLRPHEIEIGDGGLQGVFGGLQRLRNQQVSARKLVYRIKDTP